MLARQVKLLDEGQRESDSSILSRKLEVALSELGFASDGSLSEGPKSGNLIIQADNHIVMDGCREVLRSSVALCYLDPPYNNREVYNHYLDDMSHDLWIREITRRLVLVHDLLQDNGSLWISIDDGSMHYLKIAADLVFGRDNFVSTIVWQHRLTRENRTAFSNNHEYLLVYAKNASLFKKRRNLLPPSQELLSRYRNLDGDPRGPWQSISLTVQGGHGTASQYYELESPSGVVHVPPPGRCWVYTKERMLREIASGNVWFGAKGTSVPRRKMFRDHAQLGLTPSTLWLGSEVGTTDDAKKHILELFPGEAVFDTPKPERLMSRILEIATNEGDLILDPYLGSGTTTAVAHKLGRRYIGVEEGAHCLSLCAERMKLVVRGEAGGISRGCDWVGGGGFECFRKSRRRKKL